MVNLLIYESAVSQAVLCLPVTMEAQTQSQASPCGMCGGQSGSGTGFSSACLGFSPSVSICPCSVVIHLSVAETT